VVNEGDQPAGDEAVDEAATGITATLDLFRDVYERDSFDDAGARVLLPVHYGERYANAFWDGTHLVFGDGDGTVFRRFTRAADVLAHEFSTRSPSTPPHSSTKASPGRSTSRSPTSSRPASSSSSRARTPPEAVG